MNCHTGYHSLWVNSDHALANRPVNPARDEAAFSERKSVADGGSAFDLAWHSGRPTMTPRTAAGVTAAPLSPDLILGNKPLWQPLVPTGKGRWQPTDLAYDPAKKERFNVFGQEQRQAGE